MRRLNLSEEDKSILASVFLRAQSDIHNDIGHSQDPAARRDYKEELQVFNELRVKLQKAGLLPQ